MSEGFDFKKFKKEIVELINDLRKDHGAPALEYKDSFEKGAIEKATSLLADPNVPTAKEPRAVNDVVIFLTTNMPVDAKYFVEDMKKKETLYDYNKGEFVEKAGGLTQAIWVNTKKIAVGYSQSGDKFCFVFRYSPYGNVTGRFLVNVFPKGTPMNKRTTDGPFPINEVPTPEALKEYFLKAHNQIRKAHGCKPLVWDDNLASLATKAAEAQTDAALKKKEAPKFLPDYGKNVACSSNGIPSPTEVMTCWYSTKKHFDYGKYEVNESNGSFVQMVLKATEKIGVGCYQKDDNCYYVAYYSPRGIITEDVKEEIPAPVSKEEVVFEEY